MPDLRIQSILRCLAAIAQHHGLSADPAQLIKAHDLGAQEPDTARLQTLATDIGLDASPGTLSWKNLLTQQKRFPLLARLTDGTGLIVVGARHGAVGKVAVLDPADKQPKVRWLGRQPFCRRWRGDVMFLQPQAAPSPHDILIQGIEFQHQGRTDEAARLFQAVLAAHPNHPAALYSLAVIAMDRADPEEALRLTETGVLAAPDFAPIWFAHATALRALGRQEEALANYDRALEIQPDYLEALTNSGVLLRELLRHGEALERFNRILTIDPNSTTALANCAILLTEFKQSEEAIKLFERLLALNPDFDYGLGLLCYERLHICDWTDYESQAARIIEGLRAGRRVCKTLALMAICDSAEDHFRAARIFAESYCPRQPIALWQGEQYKHDRIRIAYVSADLREHPVGHLMAGVFEHHDKSRFETIAISVGIDDQSRLRERMVKAFDHFIDARLMGSRQIAEKMREMEVDIAIDLSGYTADSRIHVFAYRPAPVQVGYLGYPGTLGTDYMDYIIADRHVIPEEHQPFYSERVLYLPESYLPTDDSIRISERTPTRAECGLPETGFVFCSFSHDYKITPSIFSVWMRLLNQVPGSVLWLMSRNELSQRNLRSEAGRHGVDPARLIFASRVPRIEDHLARYRQADLFLDTHPYNAHTTAADALMAGLPVVTYMGNAFPSRVAGSLLYSVGLGNLVGQSLEQYESLALELANNPEELLRIKVHLKESREAGRFFDSGKFCSNLEFLFLSLLFREAENFKSVPFFKSDAHLNFVVMTPPYSERSGGSLALWRLIEALKNKGQAVKVCLFCSYSDQTMTISPDGKSWYCCHERSLPDYYSSGKDKPVFIVPEVFCSRWLAGMKVVRYYLNRLGVLGIFPRVNDDEFKLSFSPLFVGESDFFLPQYNGKINLEYARNLKMEPRKLNLTYIGKGGLYVDDPKVFRDSVLMTRSWPETRDEYIHLLENTNFVFSYDVLTAVLMESVLLGAIPVILCFKPFSREEMLDSGAGFPFYEIVKDEYRPQVDFVEFCRKRMAYIEKLDEIDRSFEFRVSGLISCVRSWL
ncbi:tetratricopeptide repeat protein [Thiobaca trueperi]|uniref:protein O-GlcNAc transferase n=1 Tax=Thiobaca trueperi TaxID=127458 RepID=A0A4R3MY78_9GAMM|nr:tetratricopeptide repeat protein [Thiobaca trueperi]TCT21325.1 putative O-linked N-acetylglucosamine transferase (SPINDLY family) [Thiobaca trueperi]